MPTLSRRTLLQVLGGAAAVSVLPVQPAGAADVYDTMRLRWRDLLLGSGFDPAAEPFAGKLRATGESARGFAASMSAVSGSLWPDLSYDDPEPDTDPESYTYSSRITESYRRLRTMAEAYAQPGTGSTGSTTLRDRIVAGLDHLYADIYHENTTRFGNWWHWQIGAPQALMDTCVIMYDQLTATQIASYCRAVDTFVPDSAVSSYTGTSTGANRVDLCRSIALRAVVGRSSARLTVARDALSPVFPYVTTGDGLYADGSFVQHTWVAYTGGYGAPLLDGLGRLFALVSGTQWAVTDPARQIILDSVEKAYAPFIVNGLCMDGVSGRGISRSASDDHARGHAIVAAIVQLGKGASTAENQRWRGMVKGWMARAYYSPLLSDTRFDVAQLAALKAIADDRVLPATPEPVAHRVFASMDRVTHRRPGWTASVSMASRRISYYEVGNGENLRGWHTGSGMLYWWGSTYGNGQYSDAFWPTVDPYRLPGITASLKPLTDGQGGDWGAAKPDARWVGGATDGEFGATGQYLKGPFSTLVARKSWFWLDDAVVCLGAGISCTDGTAVESIVDNRNLGATGSHALRVNNVAQPSTVGWTSTFTGARSAHLNGFGGYVFPAGARLTARRLPRTGSWSQINRAGSTQAITRRYLTLAIDHGTDPAGATYAYAILPGATAAATANRAADATWLRILANTGDVQGVAVPRLGYTAANFWLPGTAGPISSDGWACVLIREKADGTAEVCVSDPMRVQTSLTITWHRPVSAVLSKPPTVTSATTGSRLTLTFGDLTGQAGATQKTVVRLS
ncbi:MAG: polysaccharide lyase 8 family protein [Micromonosporaceae bacterium]